MRTILKIEQKGLLLFAALSVFFLFFDGPGIIQARLGPGTHCGICRLAP
jgi:hypothetical protein